jgi:hypothetical protein
VRVQFRKLSVKFLPDGGAIRSVVERGRRSSVVRSSRTTATVLADEKGRCREMHCDEVVVGRVTDNGASIVPGRRIAYEIPPNVLSASKARTIADNHVSETGLACRKC